MMSNVLTFPAQLEGFHWRKDRSATLRFGTLLEISPEDIKTVAEFDQKQGHVVFSETEIQPEDIPDNEIEPKSMSQRLRAVLFVFFTEVKNGKEEDFPEFYRKYMIKKINEIKSYLPEK